MLTSGDASMVLQRGSLLMELSGNRSMQTRQLLADASQLAGVEQEMQRTETGIAGLKQQLAGHKSSLGKLIDTQKATLAGLTVPQQQAVTNQSIGANGSSAPQQYTGPTTTQAQKAVAFAYAQLGCPYVYGGTGPCPRGFDCSGLAQAAWAAAGVQIPRDSYGQWAALPHVPLSSIEPGDLLIYNGEGHVAIYVGGGYIIDAPQTGMNVEKIPESTPWYAGNLDGVLRP
jgi:cell wall-associated NlpC family hydrolase